jgi:VCBS repeat-containing protein
MSDPSGLSFTTTYTIHVTDVNEPPTDATLTNDRIPENLPAGAEVGVVLVTDPDEGETLHYSLVKLDGSSGGDDGIFAINPDTGASALNFETLPAGGRVAVRVRVTDSDQHSIDETFPINVTDVNEAPTISEIDQESEDVFFFADSGTKIGSISSH